MKRKLALLAGTCLAAASLAAPSAHAAFPGTNGRIVFGNETGIASANPDGSGFTQLTTDSPSTFDERPAWSADGKRIVFDREDFSLGFTDAIWAMNADGSGLTQLTDGAAGDSQPAFFPDGRIVFVRDDTGGSEGFDEEIWVMNGDGTGQTKLTDNQVEDFSPTVSPDGKSIAFGSGDLTDDPIYRMDPNGSNVTLVTTDHSPNTSCDSNPNYSPDGGTIVFDRETGSQECGGGTLNLFTVPAAGGAATALTNSSSQADPRNGEPAYSPDGKQIVFALEGIPLAKEPAAAGPRDALPAGSLAIMPASGGQAQQYQAAGTDPDWQPIPVAADLGTCFGQKVTIAGTQGADVIAGTPGNDVIRGFRGKDKINGKGGDDILCGGRGKDKLLGKAGDDILIGGEQSDYLNGGKGRNRLFGGTPGASPETARNVCVESPGDKLTNCQVVK